ncbi:hypothetical protein [Leuconostoc falkenbergense]|uniref:hypothetical protein n=1 Tax=Leuconostoc falkenbergense TaxID=2766470 RepID=UPI00293CC788|nr:hypothetical protein [Leuconostoc falkenbergense]MDV3544890.1 hypothetical protein [Leuconostoc falkenbergense]
MTFDEALDQLEPRTIWSSEMRDLLEQLRQEYAPTVEMTEEQKDIIMNLLDDSDISQDDWKTMINDDSPELPKISYRQAIMAYMNPETIKVVDE